MGKQRLFKVLTADGRSPYIQGYQWALPILGDDGAWVPSRWHEPAPGGRWLSVTDHPWTRTSSRLLAWECEVDGTVEDRGGGDYDAERVRLLRPVAEDELQRLRRELAAKKAP